MCIVLRLQIGVDLIFLDRLADSRANSDQDRFRHNDNIVIDKAHMCEPNLSERNEEDSLWTNTFNLAIPEVGKVQGQKSLFDGVDGRSGPQELKDHALPDLFFGWAIK